MIVEERIYTLHPGKVPEYMKLYEEEGRAAQEPILGKMVGWYYTDFGPQNQIVHMWAYDSYEERHERREKLY
ncbi:MAG: NIPSNAP family protein, partial [Alphaproteobacteria bacterium]